MPHLQTLQACSYFIATVDALLHSQICQACFERPHHWELLTALAPLEHSRSPTGYIFEKAYVVHWSARAFRRLRMVERLQGIGLKTGENGGDNVAIVSQFDASAIPADMRSRLVDHNPEDHHGTLHVDCHRYQ